MLVVVVTRGMSTPHARSTEPGGAPLADVLDRWRRRLDRVRIRQHLRRAERALREADHPGLTTLSYLTVMALFVAPLAALVVVALFP
jgi:hypothetical protein